MIAVGVDTHKGSHFAVVLDDLGQLLGELAIAVCAAGYEELERWARGMATDGQQIVFGIEGAGSWGAGLCEHLQASGCEVFEVERPETVRSSVCEVGFGWLWLVGDSVSEVNLEGS